MGPLPPVPPEVDDTDELELLEVGALELDVTDDVSPPLPVVAVELDEPPPLPAHPPAHSLNPSSDGNRQLAPTRATVVSAAASATRGKRKSMVRE